MWESFVFQVTVSCPGCRDIVPVNGIVPSLTCARCGHTIALDRAFWMDAIKPEYFVEALGFEQGKGCTVQDLATKREVDYGLRIPRCQSCKGTNLALDALERMLPQGACPCPDCGRSIRLRPADDLCLAVQPRARFMVHETVRREGERDASDDAVAIRCSECGVNLRVDGHSRTVECEFCRATNHLPEKLWATLHPAPQVEAFFMVCDYDEASLRAARAADTREELQRRKVAREEAAETARKAAAERAARRSTLRRVGGFSLAVVLFTALLIMLPLTLGERSESSAKGSLVGVGEPFGDFAMTVTDCASGQPQFFHGVVLSSARAGEMIRVVIDPLQGTVVQLQLPQMCREAPCAPVALDRGECPVFDIRVQDTGAERDDIRVLEGHLRLDCRFGAGGTAKADITFSCD